MNVYIFYLMLVPWLLIARNPNLPTFFLFFCRPDYSRAHEIYYIPIITMYAYNIYIFNDIIRVHIVCISCAITAFPCNWFL